MANYQIKDIRNLSFISHGGSGKTTMTEMFLFNSGKIDEPGTIEKGSTHSDFTPEEKKHQYSIINSYFSFPWKNKEINLIDTPGYADFRGEVASALKITENAVLLIDSTAGIEVGTNFVWSMARKNQKSSFVFLNKMDKEGASFTKVFEEITNTFEEKFVPVTIPVGEGENYQGIIDVLSRKYIALKDGKETEDNIPEDFKDIVEEYRLQLMEEVVELDDELMMKYLDDEKISEKELINALIKGVANNQLVPIFSGAAIKNSGVKSLLDYIVKLMPAPDQSKSIKGMTENGEVEIEILESGQFAGLVGKTMVDPYIGKLSIFRIYSGKLSGDTEIYLPRLDQKYKFNKLYKLNGSEQEQVEELIAGEIGAVAKVDDLETSDTITTTDLKINLDKIDFPVPMLSYAAQPASEGDDEKMSTALHRHAQEDPTFKVEYNTETKELLVTCMGTIHLGVVKDMCKRKFDVDFITSDPKVSYKETIQTKIEVEEKYKKQSGGRGQYGHVLMRMEPLARGEGFIFEEEIFGGSIPNQYIPAVEKGIVEAMNEGVLAGYPVVDFKVTLYDGSYHSVDSSEMAFKIAASKAFKKGMQQAKPVILEPIMNVEVIVPESYMGDIMGDLNSRRGKIQGMEPGDGVQVIKAQVPQSEMFSYTTDLKSITGGYGSFNMEFSHFDKVPEKIGEDIINNANSEIA